jgi:hypothetical protein
MSLKSKDVTKNNEVETMSAEQTTGRVCNEPECVEARHERDLLVASLRDSTHVQLISRDMELGLRAELMQARIDIEHARAMGAHALAMTRRSTTWRIGRLVMKPVGAAKRVLRRLKK